MRIKLLIVVVMVAVLGLQFADCMSAMTPDQLTDEGISRKLKIRIATEFVDFFNPQTMMPSSSPVRRG